MSTTKNAFKLARLGRRLANHLDDIQSEIDLEPAFINWLDGLETLLEIISEIETTSDEILGELE